MRRRFGLPADRSILLAVKEGRTMEKEIRVFQKILEQVHTCILVIIGKVVQASYQLAEQLGINQSIYWAGWVSDEDYPRYLACADVFFLPTYSDNINFHACFPGKILDFLATGRPLVTHDIGEIGMRLKNRDVSMLVQHNDQALADAVVTLLQDKERRKFLGDNARQIMLREWDWKIIGQRIATVIEV
jgi:phosphatidylinositol alpha-1,6-mannosyltransferase